MTTVNEVIDNFHLFTIQELLELQDKLYKYIANKATQETIDIDDWAKDNTDIDDEKDPRDELIDNMEDSHKDNQYSKDYFALYEDEEIKKMRASDFRSLQNPNWRE